MKIDDRQTVIGRVHYGLTIAGVTQPKGVTKLMGGHKQQTVVRGAISESVVFVEVGVSGNCTLFGVKGMGQCTRCKMTITC